MGERIQHKLDEMEKLAQASKGSYIPTKRSAKQVNDSLAKGIKTKKDADRFLAELEMLSKLAQTK